MQEKKSETKRKLTERKQPDKIKLPVKRRKHCWRATRQGIAGAWKRRLRLDGLIRASRFLLKKLSLLRLCLKKTHDETAEKLQKQKTAKFNQTNTARAALFTRRALRFSTAVYSLKAVSSCVVG